MFRSFLIVIFSFSFLSLSVASEEVPDDIRYMLEDMYSSNKSEWPSPRYKTDLNKDGFTDWVAVKKGCTSKEGCSAEIFLCLPDKTGKCVEYCYSEIKNIKKFTPGFTPIKCESTC